MANNIPVNVGSGATVATDQLTTGEHVQIMKLMDGTEDGTGRIGGSAANGLQVDVTRVQGTVTVDTELVTVDLDPGAGADNRVAVGIMLAASGGSVPLQGDSTNGAKVQITTMPGADATTDSLAAYAATDKIYNATVGLTPKFKVVSTSTSGAGTLVPLVASKKIRVIALSLMSSGTVNVKFASHTTGDVSGLYYLVANTGFVLAPNQWGWFETAVGEALDINLSAAIPVGGNLVYVEV